jgi:type I restriction enzyme R subunit
MLFKRFAAAMDKALPQPRALKFAPDLKQYSFISQVARNRYRDEKLSLKDASKKIRNIVDEYLISRGVNPSIPPIPILSEQFLRKLEKEQSPRARAEELKHGIAEHIARHSQDDPELYERLSDTLERLLRDYRNNWELLAKELEGFIAEIRQGREAEENFDLDRRTELPFFGLLKKEAFEDKTLQQLDQKDIDVLVQVTKDVLERVQTDITLVDFWNNVTTQKKLKSWISSHLLTEFKNNRTIFSRRVIISQRIMELAYHIHG